jgi:hypothetical protein
LEIWTPHRPKSTGGLRAPALQNSQAALRGPSWGYEFEWFSISNGVDDVEHVVGRFVGEFEAEVVDACFAPQIEIRARFLGFGSEDGVAAAYIGKHGVGDSGVVAQFDLVFLAGASAVFVAGSCR